MPDVVDLQNRRVLEALWAMTAVEDTFLHVEWSTIDGRRRVDGVAAAERRPWLALVTALAEDRDVLLGVAPRKQPAFGTADMARVLWVRTESKKQVDALKAFRPSPTLVLQEGGTTRMVALWALRQTLGYEWLLRANKRIAHRLGAAKKWSAPEFAFPAPGSCLRAGRSRPVLVHVEFFDSAGYFRPRDVVAGLKDAPDANAWRAAA